MGKKEILVILTLISLTVCRRKEYAEMPLRDDDKIKVGYSEVNGINMYYEIHGDSGEYLVLIHGGGSTIRTTFGRILPLLFGSFTVIAVELQAHGHTGDRDAPESFEQDADDVAALLDNLNIPKASIFGFSNGGNTAMQLAFRHPEKVDKLILASTFYKREGLPPGFFEGMKAATLNDMPLLLRNAFLEINPDSSRLMSMFQKDRDRMINFKDWDDEILRSIRAPTLIITGDQDIALPVHALDMARLIVNSRLMILPATHGSYLGVAEVPITGSKLPELTASIIKDFLKTEK
ncbi:MAG TPA: alpha/beta hydrolase [Cyclobacteriaceae bacterium]|nr:alpha/beta hydrolase [Cyclobacteriaceae bacterium]